jgi:hypothetical protein
MRRPANSNAHTEWELVPGGIRPYRREAVDCAGNEPDSDNACHNRPVWVIEDFDGHTPTCLVCSGKVLNKLLAKYENSEVSMYFHPYKGA